MVQVLIEDNSGSRTYLFCEVISRNPKKKIENMNQ